MCTKQPQITATVKLTQPPITHYMEKDLDTHYNASASTPTSSLLNNRRNLLEVLISY